MADMQYYEILTAGLPDKLSIARLVYGVSWTAAVLSDGRTGVAMHTIGESRPRLFTTLIGLPLCEAGKAVFSWNMEEAGEALAAINAYYNHPGCGFVRQEVKTLDGIDLAGRTVGMIGHMIGHSNITEELLRPAKNVYIMDREPKPGDYPDSACEYFLPSCDLVIITGSAAINKTLPRLLELSRNAEVVLAGPSVTCKPSLLELGIRRLNARVITDPEPMLLAIPEKRMSINAWSVPAQIGE
ncbi:MAG: hypothetical protein IJQ02_10560 [Oscillospiraceae bacterium]|nr:hypothetical protein [Oscillospiraceae bacterium]